MTSFEISAGSTSRWTTFASGAKVESLPVTRSSKRAPSAMSEVGVLDGVVREARAVHAEHAEALRVRLREGALAVERRHHRRAQELAEREDLLVRVGRPHAAAQVDDRARGGADEQRGVLEPRLLADRRVVAGDVHGLRVLELELGVEDVLRDVHQHRPGAAGPRDVEGLLHDARDVARRRSRASCAS